MDAAVQLFNGLQDCIEGFFIWYFYMNDDRNQKWQGKEKYVEKNQREPP